MKTFPQFYLWPEIPALPVAGEIVLFQFNTDASRPVAREQVRAAIREILASWSEMPAELLPLRETETGPVWVGLLKDQPLDISLAYAGTTAWLAFRRGGFVGVDAMRLEEIPELEDVARQYFDSQTLEFLKRSSTLAHAFATAWTQQEAKFKCAKRGLIEQPAHASHCVAHSLSPSDKLIVSVVIS